MAVNKVPQGSMISITVQSGVTGAGGPAYKKMRFPNVKTTAIDADFYEIADAVAGLQRYPVTEIERIDTANLTKA